MRFLYLPMSLCGGALCEELQRSGQAAVAVQHSTVFVAITSDVAERPADLLLQFD